jgi:hypothetical protein
MRTLKPVRIACTAVLAAALAAPFVLLAADAPAEQFATLKKEYDTAYAAYLTEARAAKNPTPEQRAALTAKSPLPKYSPKFLELGEKLGKDPAAVDALIFAIRLDGRGANGQKAMERLERDHYNSPQMSQIVGMLRSFRTPAADKLLATITEKNTDPGVQGGLLMSKATAAKTTNPAEAEKLFNQIIEKFASAKSATGTTTLGELAKSELAAMKNATNFDIGKVAPDIEGEDLSGVKFKLSDYRGKVVVIDFWGDW